jgi:CDP-L-myo-inositol myo-inositolphosphotransferase
MLKKDDTSSKFDFQKSLKEVTPYPILDYFRVERYFTRPLASLIARAVYNTSITPNQLTYFSFFLGICSGISFFMGDYVFFVLGGILAQLSSIFDCSDGMLARSKKLCTEYGTYLDIFLDRIADFFIFGGGIIGYYRYSENWTVFLIGLIGLTLYFLQTTLYYLMIMYQSKKTGLAAEARGLVIFALFVFSILNRLDLFITILAFLTVCNVVFKLINFIRWGRIQRGTTKS